MYMGPWQEFRLAKLLRINERPENQPFSQSIASSPLRSRSNITSTKHGYTKTVNRLAEVSFRLPAAYQHLSREHDTDFDELAQDETAPEAKWAVYREQLLAKSRLSYTEDLEASAIKTKPRHLKQGGILTTKRHFILPSLRHAGDQSRQSHAFENQVIRENYPPLETQPLSKGSTLRRRLRKM